MSAYHQMGHDSESMITEPELNKYAGAILSPINYSVDDTISQCIRFRSTMHDFDIIFDPQLYVPSVSRGKLQHWPHKPSDLDTADHSSIDWWKGTVSKIIDVCESFKPNGLCSPAFVPKVFDDNYYSLLVDIANITAAQVKERDGTEETRTLFTALVGLADIGRNDRHLQVASILSRFTEQDIYLVFSDDERPRIERSESSDLEGAARLIRILNQAGSRITVGFTSTELLLWKAAGAANVATGKFFNLRRFTKGRWDEDEASGGRNISYWTEPSLLGFLREADLIRYKREFSIDPSHDGNPFSQIILEKLDSSERKPWVADSWRQFLHWFADCESNINNNFPKCVEIVSTSLSRWHEVREAKLRFEEERNTGDWIQAWDIVLNELERRPD